MGRRSAALALWHWIVRGYLRLIDPLVEACVRLGVSPNALTLIGTGVAIGVGGMFAAGWMHLAGWTLGLLAFFDVIDGAVARRAGRTTPFGGFLDSTMDRVADGALLGGIVAFYATHPHPAERGPLMLAVALVALVAIQLTSYTRAKADLLGVDLAGVGWFERPERITLLAAPQAFFGLRWEWGMFDLVVGVLALAAVVTVGQRLRHVARALYLS
ncbi:MAG: hypothetical protein RLZZ63_741 [Gemmatimonadota bacterium]|jgi:phosphatidylglycerophosphate synthase